MASSVIIVTGFMGTGKTAVGRELAAMLGLDFVDTDAEIVNSAGKSIADIFADDGEARFRELERELCKRLAARRGVVIATGGGTLVDDVNYDRLSGNGHVVTLDTSLDVLCKRLDNDGVRPLLGNTSGDAMRKRIELLLEDRADAYDRADMRIDTSDIEATEAAAHIATRLDLPHHTTLVNLVPAADPKRVPYGRAGKSDVYIGRGVLSTLGYKLKAMGLDTHAFLLIPENVLERYLTQIEASLEAALIPFSLIPVRDGDRHKHLAQASEILDQIVDNGAKRDSVIVPVGGGVTGDIGGFVASMYMRGIAYVQVPTTVIAQVDSAVGAKVGVNHPLAKNIIGAFYQPHFILIDPCTLRTLPLEELANGMAEVVKSALIASPALFEYLESQMESDARRTLRDIDFLERCIMEASTIKCGLVNEDPYESGPRQMLNLGHTLGHALESAGEYEAWRHGEAVSLGIVAAYRIAARRGFIDDELRDRVVALLGWCRLPVEFDELDRGALTRSMQLDKKFKKGRLHYVLPTALGKATVVDDVTVDEIFDVIEEG